MFLVDKTTITGHTYPRVGCMDVDTYYTPTSRYANQAGTGANTELTNSTTSKTSLTWDQGKRTALYNALASPLSDPSSTSEGVLKFPTAHCQSVSRQLSEEKRRRETMEGKKAEGVHRVRPLLIGIRVSVAGHPANCHAD